MKSGTLEHPSAWRKFAMLAEPYFGFAKGPVLIEHQAEEGQQLRCVMVFAETDAVAKKHGPTDLQGDASKQQESDFGHRTSCLGNKKQSRTTAYVEFRCRSEDVNRARQVAKVAHLSDLYSTHLQRAHCCGPATQASPNG
ncbi:MAG: hypothetical protein ACRD5K_01370 [Candidatus Acidiferrales bacterium]